MFLLIHRLLLLLDTVVQEGDLLGGGVPGDGLRHGLGGEAALPLVIETFLSSAYKRPGMVLGGVLACLLLSGVGDLE